MKRDAYGSFRKVQSPETRLPGESVRPAHDHAVPAEAAIAGVRPSAMIIVHVPTVITGVAAHDDGDRTEPLRRPGLLSARTQ